MNKSNQITIFKGENIGSVRTAIDDKARIVFSLNDSCKILDIKNSRDAKRRLKPDGLSLIKVEEGKKAHTFITEENLYRLIFQSRKEEAVKFMDWVVEEVLPSLRVKGYYSMDDIFKSKDSAVAFITDYKNVLVKNGLLEKEILETKEARSYMKRTMRTYRLTDLEDLPHKLNIHNLNYQDLVKFLRDKAILDDNNIPFQSYVDKGWFRIDTHSFTMDKSQVVIKRVCVFQKGINSINDLIKNSGGVL